MLLEKINHGLAVFILDPEDCARLARACDQRASEMPTVEEAPESAMLSVYAAAFQAAAVATAAQGEKAMRVRQ